MDETTNPKRQPKLRRNKGEGVLGRPPSASLRDRVVAFRVTADEHFKLMEKARRSGLSPGEYARSRALRGIAREKRAPRPQMIFGDDTRAIFHEVRRQGVNLNQIAHHCNRHQVPPPPGTSDLAQVLIGLWQKLLP